MLRGTSRRPQAWGSIAAAADVHADETSIRQINIEERAYIWDFVTPDLIVYCYAPSRTGDTPNRIGRVGFTVRILSFSFYRSNAVASFT